MLAVALLGSFLRIGRQDNQPSVDGKGFPFDAESGTLLVRKGGADPGPFLLGFAVTFIFLDGEDVEKE